FAFTGFQPKDLLHWNQYGFTLSGPVTIPKFYNGANRLFFMSNFEGYRDRRNIQNTFTLPTATMRGGDFSGRQPIYDPATRAGMNGIAQPFTGNAIPRNRIHPSAIRLLEFYPEPNAPAAGLGSNYLAAPARRIDKDQFNQRI